jgi:hypothetical protein
MKNKDLRTFGHGIDICFSVRGIEGPGRPAGRTHAIRPACRMMLRIMSGNMKAWNGSMEYQ